MIASPWITVGDEVISEEANAQFAARGSRIEGIVVEKLGDELVGAKPEDERSLDVVIPDDYEKEELRGKTAQFNFKIHDVKRINLPPLNDEFAGMMGLETVDELKSMVRAESESRIRRDTHPAVRRG